MPSLFISYGHKDMESIDWLERLKLYLAPLRRNDVVDVWDDTLIDPGSNWRAEIKHALEQASAAILLVGPGFLASEFIANRELPQLLAAAKNRGAKIYPLVIGYCAYTLSDLEPYQTFNTPGEPLESLKPAEQNRILNELCLAVDQDIRHARVAESVAPENTAGLHDVIKDILKHLKSTDVAFQAQKRRRNGLVQTMRKRLNVQEHLQYEKFFFRYYKDLNDEEKFEFEQIRAITEGPLHTGNQKILQIIESMPAALDEILALEALRQHLVFWLNKYDRVFTKREEMCLLYTGVEDGVPFPSGVENDIQEWLDAHQ